jgi:hypothetical protein
LLRWQLRAHGPFWSGWALQPWRLRQAGFWRARHSGLARRHVIGIERHQRSRLIRWEFLADFARGF